MKLILFDLDGTLLTAGGVGRRSTRSALQAVFGSDGNLDEIYPGGRTQEAIFLDTLLDMGYSKENFLEKREMLYAHFLDRFRDDIRRGNHQIRALPGAIDLIENLILRQEVTLGIVTGNHSDNARLKLEQAGFQPKCFQVGAYGEQSANRPDLVPLAQEGAFQLTGKRFPGKSTAVVGDTTRDVLSGQSVGAQTLALTTGTDDRVQLEAVGPDQILDSLVDTETVINLLLES